MTAVAARRRDRTDFALVGKPVLHVVGGDVLSGGACDGLVTQLWPDIEGSRVVCREDSAEQQTDDGLERRVALDQQLTHQRLDLGIGIGRLDVTEPGCEPGELHAGYQDRAGVVRSEASIRSSAYSFAASRTVWSRSSARSNIVRSRSPIASARSNASSLVPPTCSR